MKDMHDYSDCPDYVREFLFYMLTIKGRSQRTVDAYYIDLRVFLRYLKCVKLDHVSAPGSDDPSVSQIVISDIPLQTLETLSLGDVYNYLNYTASTRENVAKTRSRKVSSIRALFSYLTIKSHYLEHNPVENLDVPTVRKSIPRYLTLEESLELLTALDSADPDYARDYCMLTLFLNCGMRLSELVGLNITDIRDNTVRVLGKGNKERIIYLNDACQKALNMYLPLRKIPHNVDEKYALFVSSQLKRLSGRRVQQIIEEILQRAGLSGRGYSPHKLRHTAATLMYQHGGVDVRVLQEILGHSNLGTTEIYTHLSSSQMENAAKSTPIANVVPKAIPKAIHNLDSEQKNTEAKKEQRVQKRNRKPE